MRLDMATAEFANAAQSWRTWPFRYLTRVSAPSRSAAGETLTVAKGTAGRLTRGALEIGRTAAARGAARGVAGAGIARRVSPLAGVAVGVWLTGLVAASGAGIMRLARVTGQTGAGMLLILMFGMCFDISGSIIYPLR